MTANISWSENAEETNFAKNCFTDILRFDSHALLGFFLSNLFLEKSRFITETLLLEKYEKHS